MNLNSATLGQIESALQQLDSKSSVEELFDEINVMIASTRQFGEMDGDDRADLVNDLNLIRNLVKTLFDARA